MSIFYAASPQVQRVQKVQKVQKVQRVVGKVLKIDRPVGRRVLKFDGPTGRGLWYRPAGDEFYKSASQNGKPNNRAAPVGNAPLSPYGDFPRRGKFALCSAFGLIRCEQHFGELAACAGHPLSGFAGLLHGKASHLVLRSLCSPTNQVRLPPLFRGQNKPQISNRFINISTHSAAKTSPSGGSPAKRE